MILVDANLLIYAQISSFSQHQVARDWFDEQLNGTPPVGLARITLVAFLRIVTILAYPIGPCPRPTHGGKCSLGLPANRSGRPGRPSVIGRSSANFSSCRPGFMATWFRTLTWPRWQSSTG